ncbi:hypothetical protein A3D14_01275 [Candidatus Saccharibacteria bacterium RIFCSPHIGHO2_02_FULL_47_12]|nr:MAG: hypothetical protein A3D14_01275 [Candidatus Saccharibacteria bacterium RIFCSPHIGHO2_02_FULL_47_12]
MNKKSINRISLLKIAVLYGGLLIFLMSTDPTKLSLPLLLIPFIWIGLCLYVLIKQVLGHISGRFRRISKKRKTSIAFTLAAVPVCMLLLRSIGQLTIRDVLILAGLIAIGTFYVGRVRLA